MNFCRCLVIAGASVLLAACPSPPARHPPGGGEDIGPTTRDCRTSSGKCRVMVAITGSCTDPRNVTVDPETLELNGKPNRRLVWTLPGDYRFCSARGDGVQFKLPDNDGQFSDGRPTDDEDGAEDGSGNQCRKRFSWRNRNDRDTWGEKYAYNLRFTGPSGESCFVDPWVRNR